MNALEFVRALAEAHHEEAAGAERANLATAASIDLAERFAEAVRKIPVAPEGDQGGNAGPATTGRRSGIARDSSDGTSSRTIQGPNGLEVEIVDSSGRVLSVVPVGPQREPATGPFGGGGGNPLGGAPIAPPGGGSGAPTGPPEAGGAQVLRAGLPTSGRPITGHAGAKTVVAPLEVLQQYCSQAVFTVPDSSVVGASPTKGPWVRRTVWTCPVVPLILPDGGEFMEETPLPGGGLGFGSAARPSGTGAAASTNPGKGGADFGQHVAGSASGRDASGNAIFSSSSASPSPPTAPTPGERLISASTQALAAQVGRLAEKIGSNDGGLSLRAKGLTL